MTDLPVETMTLSAVAHGWLRRPEMDTSLIDVWELPDGRLYAAPKGHTPQLVTLVQPT